MASEEWESGETGERYQPIMEQFGSSPAPIIACFRCQRPWHSKIRLPVAADDHRDADFYHLESHDLDCVIVVIRMLISLDFAFEVKHRTSALATCVSHNFGWDRRADYEVKGMLIQKLFPEAFKDKNSLNNIQVLLPNLTFESLIQHQGIKVVLFGADRFCLRSHQLMIYGRQPNLPLEEIRETTVESMIDTNQVSWDGIRALEETVAEQAYEFDFRADNGTKISARYCAVPDFIRVMFTPTDHSRNFEDVLRFKLAVPTLRRDDDGTLRQITSDLNYILVAVVKIDRQDPIQNPAEVRLYEFNARMMLPDLQSNIDHRPICEQKIRPDSRWAVGDPKFKFMLFYRKYGPWPGAVPPPPPLDASRAEYLDPLPRPDYLIPRPPTPDAPSRKPK